MSEEQKNLNEDVTQEAKGHCGSGKCGSGNCTTSAEKSADTSGDAAPKKPCCGRGCKSKAGKLYIKQIKSPIGRTANQRATLKGLGLDKIGRTAVVKNNPAMLGMLRTVQHLIEVEVK